MDPAVLPAVPKKKKKKKLPMVATRKGWVAKYKKYTVKDFKNVPPKFTQTNFSPYIGKETGIQWSDELGALICSVCDRKKLHKATLRW